MSRSASTGMRFNPRFYDSITTVGHNNQEIPSETNNIFNGTLNSVMIITTKIFLHQTIFHSGHCIQVMRTRSVRFLVRPPYWISTGQLIIGGPWVSLNWAINVRWVPLSTLFSVYKTILMVIFLKPLKKPLWHVTTNFILNSCIFKRHIFSLGGYR